MKGRTVAMAQVKIRIKGHEDFLKATPTGVNPAVYDLCTSRCEVNDALAGLLSPGNWGIAGTRKNFRKYFAHKPVHMVDRSVDFFDGFQCLVAAASV